MLPQFFRQRFNPSVVSCRAILYELGLQGKLTTDQLAKKWDNLKRRYKVGVDYANDLGQQATSVFSIS